MDISTLLQDIIAKNHETEIGKKWKFGEIMSLQDYQEQVPITSYDDYRSYIDRMAEHGEQNLLTSEAVVQFAPSSGTTGKMKLIPLVESVTNITSASSMIKEADKILNFASVLSNERQITAPCGVLIQGLGITSIHALLQACPENFVVPAEAYSVTSATTFADNLHIQLLFGLKDTMVNKMWAVFIRVILLVLRELTLKWPELVNEIETGKLNKSLSIPAKERKILEAKLGGPDPTRADELNKIFLQAATTGFRKVVPVIWPNLELIVCGCSGTFASLVPGLQYYTGPETSVHPFGYVSSEGGVIGWPVRPEIETSLFKLTPNNFCEFIPLIESTKDQPKTLLPSEVEAGEIYEIVITTKSGFYRYRIGDYIKVIEQTTYGPLIDLRGRTKMILHLKNHALYEASIESAMTIYSKTTQSPIEYTISIDEDTYSCYRVWIECDGDDKFVGVLDENLQEVDKTYEYERKCGKIDQLVVSQVRTGTFTKILAYMKSKTVSSEDQLKIPHMLFQDEEASQEIKKILDTNKY